ncbi:MAG: CopG family transcriptional regulator [Proteobacteria bacterium]|nr:MAG: CopG family transcriptional regulator [Pseudomonadota bacterium]
MQNPSTLRMNISIDSLLKQDIDAFSKELGKSKSRLIAEALEYYFDILDLKIAEKRMNDKIISSQEMDKWINEL